MFPPFTPDVKRGINYLDTKDFEQSDFGQDIDPLTKLIVGASYSTLNDEYIEKQYDIRINRFLKIDNNVRANYGMQQVKRQPMKYLQEIILMLM